MKLWRWTALTAAAGLAACGGGSGSNGTSGGLASTGTTGLTQSASFTLSDGGTITINHDGTATLTDPGVNAGLPTALAPTATVTAPTFAGSTTLAGTGIVLERMGPAAGLSVSDFGVWNTRDPNPSPANFYAAGQATAPSLLPPQGMGITATYNGSYIANLSGNTIYEGLPLAAGPFSGSVAINANFDTRALSASFGGLLAAQISMGSTYNSATGAYTIGGNTASNFALGTFTLSGRFYGAPATHQAPPETAGLLSGTLDTVPYSGAFGAHR